MKTKPKKAKLVLESLMGDPVMSHCIGPEGIAAGTALGRVSSYLFPPNEGQGADSNAFVANSKPESPPTDPAEVVDLESNPRPAFPSSEADNLDADPNHLGRYAVFASYSDEPVYGVHIEGDKLTCLIGTNYLTTYDILNYKILNQAVLQIPNNSIKGYRQIVQGAGHVLISSVKGVILIYLRSGTVVSLNTRMLINNSILTFEYPYLITTVFNYQEEAASEKLINVYKIVSSDDVKSEDVEKLERTVEIGVYEKDVHLITNCKLWHNLLIVVCDLLTILLYSEDNVLHAKKRFKHDILNVNADFADYFITLNKNSKLNILNSNLDILHTIDLYPSSFELGWNYNLINYKNMVSYNCDEGIYYLRLNISE